MANDDDETESDEETDDSAAADEAPAPPGEGGFLGEIDNNGDWNQILDRFQGTGVPVVLVLYCNEGQPQPGDAQTLAGEFPGVAFVTANSFTVQQRVMEGHGSGSVIAAGGLLMPTAEQHGVALVAVYSDKQRRDQLDAPSLEQFRELVARNSP